MKFTIWHFRSLFWAFVKRDLQERIAGSLFGPLLLVLQPLSQILVYIFLFKYIFKVRIRLGNTSEDFLLYFLVGFIPWSIHNEALFRGTNSLLAQGHLLKKVLFPPYILPLSSTLATYLLGSAALGALLLILGIYGRLTEGVLLFPFIYVLQFLFTLGVTLPLAALIVYLRDLQSFLGIFLSIWFYCTPILYSVEMIPPNLRFLFLLNPFTYITRLWQSSLLGIPFSWLDVSLSLLITALSLVFGWWFFDKCSTGFADVL